MTALREIKLLMELKHPNIIRLIDVFPHKRNLNLVRPRRSRRAPRTALVATAPLKVRLLCARCLSSWKAILRL